MSTLSSGRRARFLGVAAMALMMSMSFIVPQLQAHASNAIDIWWPTNGANVSGTQPFKALLQNQPLTSYKMYWQVDNGQLNLMADSNVDYPHKESSVDLSGWNWKGQGPYTINFVAKDLSGNTLSQQSAQITIGSQQNQPATLPQATTPTAQVPASTQTATQPAPNQTSNQNGSYSVTISAPSVVGRTQTLSAQVTNLAPSQYAMYWQVDGGQLNQMQQNSTGYSTSIDFSGWTWHGNGPYTINFVAKNSSGAVIAQNSLAVYTSAAAANTAPSTTSQTTTATQPTNPAPATNAANATLSIIAPGNGATVSGVQTLKAAVQNLPFAYTMYWQVDGGQLNQMQPGSGDYEANIDFSGWTWHGNGPYTINFVAKNNAGTVIAQQSVQIYVGSAGQPATNQAVTTTPVAQPTPTPTLNNANSTNPLAGARLWVNPNSDPANYVKRTDISSYQRQMMQKLAEGAETQWFSLNWIGDMYSAINNYVTTATNAGAVPTMVLYDIPNRDCGGYSNGGASSDQAYQTEVNNFANGIGSRKAAVILEPDALSLTSCLNSSQLQDRYNLIKYAVQKFKSNPNTAVYIDIGHPGWLSASDAASKLAQADVQDANGFALNVSNFNTDQENTDYGTQIVQQLQSMGISGKHFVVDRGRNGNGGNGEWCNPSGRALGNLPTTNTGNPLIDAFLWVKGPGGSDGNCNGGPAAGTFWPDYAIGLAAAAHW